MAALPPKRLCNFLLENGVPYVFHANSVATSCHFLRENSLLSRGVVERQGLKQTSQYSDNADKRYSIWYDVFVDTVDIHARARRYNEYGPVTFKIDTEIIGETNAGWVWVTKLNPTKWANKTNSQRWFQNMEDLENNFRVGTFDHMIVFRHCGGQLPLHDYLERIILDDPEISRRGIEFYSSAHGALSNAMSGSKSITPIRRRSCGNNGCSCVRQYERNMNNTSKMFAPIFLNDR